jgi:small-conductance mechanosensitive channel
VNLPCFLQASEFLWRDDRRGFTTKALHAIIKVIIVVHGVFVVIVVFSHVGIQWLMPLLLSVATLCLFILSQQV